MKVGQSGSNYDNTRCCTSYPKSDMSDSPIPLPVSSSASLKSSPHIFSHFLSHLFHKASHALWVVLVDVAELARVCHGF